MDFEDRIRSALKQDTLEIQVESHVRQKISERIGQPKGLRKWLIRIGVTGLLLLGANSALSLATGDSLFNVVVHYSTASQGGSFGSGYGLDTSSPTTPSQSASSNHTSPGNTDRNTSEGSVPVVQATRITQYPYIKGNNFMDTHYENSLNSFLGSEAFPELNINNVQVDNVQGILVNKDKQKFDITSHAFIPGSENKTLSLTLYHNQEGTLDLSGQTTAENQRDVKVNSQNATYTEFTNGNDIQRYVTWRQGSWIIVLLGIDVPEAILLQIAQNVDQQAQADV